MPELLDPRPKGKKIIDDLRFQNIPPERIQAITADLSQALKKHYFHLIMVKFFVN